MARGKSNGKRLTPLETLIMNALWDGAPLSVRQVQERLHAVKPMAYNTVLTVLRILRDKRFAKSERVGRGDLYQPAVSREQMGRRSLAETVESFFAGSAGALVSQLLDSNRLSEEELARIRSEIDEKLSHNDNPASGEKTA